MHKNHIILEKPEKKRKKKMVKRKYSTGPYSTRTRSYCHLQRCSALTMIVGMLQAQEKHAFWQTCQMFRKQVKKDWIRDVQWDMANLRCLTPEEYEEIVSMRILKIDWKSVEWPKKLQKLQLGGLDMLELNTLPRSKSVPIGFLPT